MGGHACADTVRTQYGGNILHRSAAADTTAAASTVHSNGSDTSSGAGGRQDALALASCRAIFVCWFGSGGDGALAGFACLRVAMCACVHARVLCIYLLVYKHVHLRSQSV